MVKKQTAQDEQILIKGPDGDVIQISRGDFASSHYAEQGYEEAGLAPIDEAADA